jgi:hypothetical protein
MLGIANIIFDAGSPRPGRLILELLAFFLLVPGFYRYYRDLKSHTGVE